MSTAKYKEMWYNFRVTEDEKNFLQGEAKTKAMQLGQTVRELILARLKDLPVRDYTFEREYRKIMLEFMFQLQHVGNNVNQGIKALHLIKNDHKIEDGDYIRLDKSLQDMLSILNDLSYKLDKVYYR
jgi:hypothetical protein